MIFVVIKHRRKLDGNLFADFTRKCILFKIDYFYGNMLLYEERVDIASIQPCGLLRTCFTLKFLKII